VLANNVGGGVTLQKCNSMLFGRVTARMGVYKKGIKLCPGTVYSTVDTRSYLSGTNKFSFIRLNLMHMHTVIPYFLSTTDSITIPVYGMHMHMHNILLGLELIGHIWDQSNRRLTARERAAAVNKLVKGVQALTQPRLAC